MTRAEFHRAYSAHRRAALAGRQRGDRQHHTQVDGLSLFSGRTDMGVFNHVCRTVPFEERNHWRPSVTGAYLVMVTGEGLPGGRAALGWKPQTRRVIITQLRRAPGFPLPDRRGPQ